MDREAGEPSTVVSAAGQAGGRGWRHAERSRPGGWSGAEERRDEPAAVANDLDERCGSPARCTTASTPSGGSRTARPRRRCSLTASGAQARHQVALLGAGARSQGPGHRPRRRAGRTCRPRRWRPRPEPSVQPPVRRPRRRDRGCARQSQRSTVDEVDTARAALPHRLMSGLSRTRRTIRRRGTAWSRPRRPRSPAASRSLPGRPRPPHRRSPCPAPVGSGAPCSPCQVPGGHRQVEAVHRRPRAHGRGPRRRRARADPVPRARGRHRNRST